MNQAKEILQGTLENLFHRNQLMPRVLSEFTSNEQIKEMVKRSGLKPQFCFDLLVQMSIHRRANLSTLIGLLRHHFDDSQATADALYIAADNDLVNYAPDVELFVTIATISQDVQDEIDKYQFPLPMVIPPEPIKTNRDTGYTVHRKGSVILKNNHHDDDVCLDHLNRMNSIKLSINQKVMVMVQNQWRNLDKPKPDETLEEYKKRVKAFNKYDKHSREVMGLLLSEGNELYLTHAYDKRGRTYCRGYHVNYQGNDWNKAVVEFADKEIIE